MEAIDKERFGAFLTQLRKEKNLTQQELADQLFVSNKAVSKWERGQSLPDISLLTPLAQLLGVTVAELLQGEWMTEETLKTCEADALVSKALQLSEEEQTERRKKRKFWQVAWVACAGIAALETGALIAFGQLTAAELWDFLLLVEGLMLGFGCYFCFFSKETLPAYYDENKISAYSDGIFRMNLLGVRLNNSNWPHILNAGRRWMLTVAVLYPPAYGFLHTRLPGQAQLFLTLAACLGFFLPMYVAGKRNE